MKGLVDILCMMNTRAASHTGDTPINFIFMGLLPELLLQLSFKDGGRPVEPENIPYGQPGRYCKVTKAARPDGFLVTAGRNLHGATSKVGGGWCRTSFMLPCNKVVYVTFLEHTDKHSTGYATSPASAYVRSIILMLTTPTHITPVDTELLPNNQCIVPPSALVFKPDRQHQAAFGIARGVGLENKKSKKCGRKGHT